MEYMQAEAEARAAPRQLANTDDTAMTKGPIEGKVSALARDGSRGNRGDRNSRRGCQT